MEMLFTFDDTWSPQQHNSGSVEYTLYETIIREVIRIFTTSKDNAGAGAGAGAGGWGLGVGGWG